jgi:hypothetical protein
MYNDGKSDLARPNEENGQERIQNTTYQAELTLPEVDVNTTKYYVV